MVVKLLQSKLWGEQKSHFGWQQFFLNIDGEEILVLARDIFRGKKIAYIPYGFENCRVLEKVFDKLISQIKETIKGVFAIRFDLADYKSFSVEEGIDTKYKFDLLKSLKKSSTIQPPDTVVLNLSERSEEELLSAMHKKCRYNIKLANKKGVEVTLATKEELQKWYELYLITAKRDGIAIHSFDYYKMLFDLASDKKFDLDLKLYLATHEGDLLAGIIVALYKNQAIYLYGASSNIKREFMPSYALQWRAIVDAKNSGATTYDFFGIPPVNSPKHSMYGLYRFKTSFGGELIHRAGAYDYPIKKTFYALFRFIERLRFFYFRVLKKR